MYPRWVIQCKKKNDLFWEGGIFFFLPKKTKELDILVTKTFINHVLNCWRKLWFVKLFKNGIFHHHHLFHKCNKRNYIALESTGALKPDYWGRPAASFSSIFFLCFILFCEFFQCYIVDQDYFLKYPSNFFLVHSFHIMFFYYGFLSQKMSQILLYVKISLSFGIIKEFFFTL